MKKQPATKNKPATKKEARTFKAYMLRTCAADMTAYGGFKWPKEGDVIAPDWSSAKVCGGGLHGLLWGEGDGSLLDWTDSAKWLVCGIDEWVELDGKVKSPRATVIYSGTKEEAAALIGHLGGGKYAVCAGTATAGDSGTIMVKWWDGKRYRITVGYCNENGIEPNKKYRCDDQGNLIPA